MEVFVEEKVLTPQLLRFSLGEIWQGRNAFFVSAKQGHEPPFELAGNLTKVHFWTCSGGKADLKAVAEEDVVAFECVDEEKVDGKPDGSSPIGVASEHAGARLSWFVADRVGLAVEVQDERLLLVDL